MFRRDIEADYVKVQFISENGVTAGPENIIPVDLPKYKLECILNAILEQTEVSVKLKY